MTTPAQGARPREEGCGVTLIKSTRHDHDRPEFDRPHLRRAIEPEYIE